MHKSTEVEIQKQYYLDTANTYDSAHLNQQDEHYFALSIMLGALDYIGVNSILDIGSGTGRALVYLMQNKPELETLGIEPVKELREIGYSKGISPNRLIEGDATDLAFEDNQFDLVCEFGVLHHIKNSDIAVSEMLRVAKKAVFISDSNNFGQGSKIIRFIKQSLNLIGLWPIADYIKTRGKGYTISEGDGLSYSYSVFNDLPIIKQHCKSVHLFNTKGSGSSNLYRTAGHVAILGIK